MASQMITQQLSPCTLSCAQTPNVSITVKPWTQETEKAQSINNVDMSIFERIDSGFSDKWTVIT